MIEKILFIMPDSNAEMFIAAAATIQKYKKKLLAMKRQHQIQIIARKKFNELEFLFRDYERSLVFISDLEEVKIRYGWDLVFSFDYKTARQLGELTNKNVVECFCNMLGVDYDNCLPVISLDCYPKEYQHDIGVMKISNREKLIEFISLNKPQMKVLLIDTDNELEQMKQSLTCKMLIGKQSASTYIMAAAKRLVVEYSEEKQSYRNWLYKETPNCMMILNPNGIQYITSEACWSTINRLWSRFPNV